MTTEVRNLRLRAFTSAELNRNVFTRHEIYLDVDNYTLRIMNGSLGGVQLLRADLSNLVGTLPIANGTITNNKLANNTVTIGSTSLPLGGTITSLVGFTSINSTAFAGTLTGNVTGNLTGNVTGNLTGNVTGNLTGTVTGNSSTASKLLASKNINGVAFDGTANITVTADSATLTGSALAGNITASSLTSTGTLTDLSVANTIIAGGAITAPVAPVAPTDATNKQYVDKKSIAMAVALG